MLRSAGIPTLLGLLFAVPLTATTVTFTDRATWEATTPGFTTIDFEGLTETWRLYNTVEGVRLPIGVEEVQFIGLKPLPSPSYYLGVANTPGAENDFGSGSILKGPEFFQGLDRQILVNLPGGITSFGVDLMTVTWLDPTPYSYNIVWSTGAYSGFDTLAQPGRAFFGVTSDTPISQIRFILASGVADITYSALDNFSYGVADAGGEGGLGEVPETSTLMLVGTGLLLLSRLRRKQVH